MLEQHRPSNPAPASGSLPGSGVTTSYKDTFDAIVKHLPVQHTSRFDRDGELPGGSIRHIHPERAKVDWVVITITKPNCPHEAVKDYPVETIQAFLDQNGTYLVSTIPNPRKAPFDGYDSLTKDLITKTIQNFVGKSLVKDVTVERIPDPLPPLTPEEEAIRKQQIEDMGPIKGWRGRSV